MRTQERGSGKGRHRHRISKDSKGNQEPYLSNERYPKISGVVVVAEGGKVHVIQNIQEAVQALFQVEAHKIKVMKMVTDR